MKRINTFAITLVALVLSSAATLAQSTAFNYTGCLLEGNAPANGSNDLQFILYAAPSGGLPLGSALMLSNTPVNNGIFVVSLDFGGTVFNGNARWLEISARPGGSGNPFTNTFPRQAITAAPYAIYANNGVPPGSVMAYMGATPPAGWLLCDGSAVSRTTYAALYAAVGDSSGSGNGSTTFNLPDLRGMFLRGVNGGRTGTYADPGDNRVSAASGGNSGNNVGSIQTDAFKSHQHYNARVNAGISDPGNTPGGFAGLAFQLDTTTSLTSATSIPAGAGETRPKNAYVNYIIKY